MFLLLLYHFILSWPSTFLQPGTSTMYIPAQYTGAQAPTCKCHGCKFIPLVSSKLAWNGLNFHIVKLLACKFRKESDSSKNPQIFRQIRLSSDVNSISDKLYLISKLLLDKFSADCLVNYSDLKLCKCSSENICLKCVKMHFLLSLLQPNELLL